MTLTIADRFIRSLVYDLSRMKWEKMVSGTFFAILLIVGLSVYKNYGVSWDEGMSRTNGTWNYNYVAGGDRKSFDFESLQATQSGHYERYYGSAFDLSLVTLEHVLRLADSRAVYLMRHLATFGFFYLGTLAFYWLLRRQFGDWRLALLGAVFLVLSPRLFADAFYNPKDLPFLASVQIALASMILFLDNMSWQRALLHGLACALCIDIRIFGLLLPVITVVLAVPRLRELRSAGQRARANIASLGICLCAIAFGTYAFWPLLWTHPVTNFLKALRTLGRVPWSGTILYLGQAVPAGKLPWHYLFVWIAITTPLLYLILFALGLIRCFFKALTHPWRWLVEDALEVAFLVTLAAPLAAVVILHLNVYDGWRHLYFTYPALLYFSILGVASVTSWLSRLGKVSVPARILAALAVVLCLLQVSWTMIRYHPLQNIYFNRLAGRNLTEIRRRFEMDYWGLSQRKALERLLELDPSPAIRVSGPTTITAAILPPALRNRLEFTEPESATYLISFYRWHPEDYAQEDEVDAIRIDGAKICVIQRTPLQMTSVALSAPRPAL